MLASFVVLPLAPGVDITIGSVENESTSAPVNSREGGHSFIRGRDRAGRIEDAADSEADVTPLWSCAAAESYVQIVSCIDPQCMKVSSLLSSRKQIVAETPDLYFIILALTTSA